jgi:hypothetical protein
MKRFYQKFQGWLLSFREQLGRNIVGVPYRFAQSGGVANAVGAPAYTGTFIPEIW